MRNRYLLLLNNNYSNKKWCIELFNSSCDPREYVFDNFGDMVPEYFEYGVYDYALLHCSIPYEVEFSPVLLDSRIITSDGTFTLRQLSPETGMLEFRPSDDPHGFDTCERINVRNYDSIS